MRCSICTFVWPDEESLAKHEIGCEEQQRAFCSEVKDLAYLLADADCDEGEPDTAKQRFDDFMEGLDKDFE